MPVKRRTNKRRDELTDNARAWLRGEPCGFFEFKGHEELLALWQAHGDESVATWDLGSNSIPTAVAD
jgi:hypothetical protein